MKFFEKNQCEVGGDNLEKLSLYSISGRGGFLSFYLLSFVQSVLTIRVSTVQWLRVHASLPPLSHIPAGLGS